MNAIIIHGAYGSPQENWFPWLKEKLEGENWNVFVPTMPTPTGQTLNNWLEEFQPLMKKIDKNTILVGHSIGAAFILRILEKLDHPLRACFLVSGFVKSLNNQDFNEINKTFIETEFNWKMIKRNGKNFWIYHSDNDPYVPLAMSEHLAKKLNIKVTLIKSAGHFNAEAGYTKFELLLKEIVELAS